jgi:glycerophosphoryl diester phosphodiesterase
MQAPENTLAAFDLAVAKGADVIELDVRRSRDGRLVVMHDATVDRTTDGTGRVADLTWDELRRLDAGGSFGPDFAGEPVPSLEEVLDRYAGRVGLLIELKEPLLYPDMLRDLAEALERRGLQDGEGGRVAVQSFDAGAIRRLRTLTPRLPIGVVVGDKPSAAITEEDLERLAAFANFVNLRLDMVNRELIASVHAQGMRVFAWTVRHPDEIPPLLEAGVDGIVTDDPELVPKR